ncbi:MAG: AsmA family protein [bacterium]
MRKALLAAGIILGILLIGLIILSTITFSHPKLKQLITTQAEKALKRNVTIDDLRINLLRGIQLKGVTITEREGPGTFIKGEEFVLKYRLWPLLRRQFVIKKIVFNEPEITIRRDKEGVFNFEDLLETEQPEEPGLSLSTSKVSLKDGRADFRDELVNKHTRLDKINLSASGLSKEKRSSFKMSMRVDETTEFKAQGHFAFQDKSLEVDLNLSKFVPARFGPYYQKYDLPFSLSAGEISTEVKLSGQLNQKLTSEGKIIIDRATLVYPEKLKQPIKDIIGLIEYDLKADRAEEGLVIDKFQAKLGELSLSLKGRINGFSRAGAGNLTLDLGFKDSKAIIDGAVKFTGPQMDIALKSERLNLDQLLAEMANLKSSSSPYPEGLSLRGRVKVDEILYAGMSFKDLNAKVNMPQGGLLKITEAVLKFGQGGLSGSVVADLNQAELSSTTSLYLRSIDLASLSDTLEKKKLGLTSPSGSLNGNFQLKTEGMEKIDLSGRLDFTSLGITYVSGQTKFPLRDLKATLRYDVRSNLAKSQLTINKLSLILPQSSLSAKGSIAHLKEKPYLSLDLVSDYISLAEIKRLMPPEALSGLKELDLAGQGQLKGCLLGPLAQIKFESDLNLEGLEISHPNLPKPIKNLRVIADFDLDPAKEYLALKKLTLATPETSLTLAGPINNWKKNLQADLDFDLWAKELNVDEILAARPAEEKAGGETGPAKPLGKALKGINLRGGAKIDRGVFKGVKFTDLKTNLEIVDGIVAVKDFQMNTWGGQVISRGEVNLKPVQPEYALKTQIKRVETNNLLSDLTPMKDMIFGQLDFDLTTDGAGLGFKQVMKTITLKGDFEVIKGKLRRIKVIDELFSFLGLTPLKELACDKLPGKIRIKQGKVELDSTSLKGNDVNLITQGSIGLDGSLDLDLTTEWADKWSSQIKNPAISSFLKNEEGRVVLAFKVSGSYDSPKFNFSTSPLQEKLKQRMEEEKEKVRKQIEAEREKVKDRAKEEVKKRIEESIPDEEVKKKVKDMMKIFK